MTLQGWRRQVSCRCDVVAAAVNVPPAGSALAGQRTAVDAS
jgi:hypothetical protein